MLRASWQSHPISLAITGLIYPTCTFISLSYHEWATPLVKGLVRRNLAFDAEPRAFQKLMVLGAGPFQAPGICKVVALGHYVISVDDRPKAFGHQFSHEYLNCRTPARGVRGSRGGICHRWHMHLQLRRAGSLSATSAIDLACQDYFRRRASMSTKHRFRETQGRAGLSHPAFIVVHSLEELQSLERDFFFRSFSTGRFIWIAWRADA